MPTYERLDYGSTDGIQIGGASIDPIGFYGATPIRQIVLGYNLSSATHASTLVSTLFSALVSSGLFSAST